jgi:hypothetical protein
MSVKKKIAFKELLSKVLPENTSLPQQLISSSCLSLAQYVSVQTKVEFMSA